MTIKQATTVSFNPVRTKSLQRSVEDYNGTNRAILPMKNPDIFDFNVIPYFAIVIGSHTDACDNCLVLVV